MQQRIVPEAGPALVHHLSLFLGIEILCNLAHDADDLPLPGLKQGGVLLDEVQNVLFRICRKARVFAIITVRLAGYGGVPQIVQMTLYVFFPVLLTLTFFGGGERAWAFVAVDSIVHQRVTGIQQLFHLFNAMLLLATSDVVLGEQQVVDDGAGIGPGSEQVVALEKGVVTIASVSDHQRLHGDGVFLHQIRDAGVGVDHDFIGQPHAATGIVLLGLHKLLAERPVVVVQRHADRGVGVHHLFRGDDLDLVGIGIKPELTGDTANFPVIGLDQLEGPV